MIVLVLLQLVLNVGFLLGGDQKVLKCPVLSRTTYKEKRTFEMSECSNGRCFQEIRLFEITEDGQYAFLYAAGCFSPSVLKPFSLENEQFVKLCEKEGVSRCVHRYQNDTFAGTLCCEPDSDEVLKSWLWDVFFGESEEMQYELESTINFLEKKKKGWHDHEELLAFPIIFGFLVVMVFTGLAFLQFYHINEGIIS